MTVTGKIIQFPHHPGSGGPGSFQIRFEKALKLKGWKVTYAGEKIKPKIIFIVGGTRRIFWLLTMKLKGVPIVYRLDGINWIHHKKKIGVRGFLLAEYRNWNNKLIHAVFADYIIYQSKFVQNWWERRGWRIHKRISVINNGVDLKAFQPLNNKKKVCLVCLENTIDYSPYAVKLLNNLRRILPDDLQINLYGRFENRSQETKLDPGIIYSGYIDRNRVNIEFQNAIYLSLDIHPACPNSVIEALACGAPVVAFDTGSLKELVPPEAGIIVPYGSDPWNVGYPDDKSLSSAIMKIYDNWDVFSKGARLTAEKYYGLNDVFNSYLNVIGELVVLK